METNSPLIVDLIRDMRAREDERTRLEEARRLGGLEQRIRDLPHLIAREVRDQLDPQIATLRTETHGLIERVAALTEKIGALDRDTPPQRLTPQGSASPGGNGTWWQQALVNMSSRLVAIIAVLVAGITYLLSDGKIIAPM